MVTPNRRRQAVAVLEDEFGVWERRACKVVGQHRSTQRHEPAPPPTDEELIRVVGWAPEIGPVAVRSDLLRHDGGAGRTEHVEETPANAGTDHPKAR